METSFVTRHADQQINLSKPTSPQGDGNCSTVPVCPSGISHFPNQLPRKGMETSIDVPVGAGIIGSPFQTNFPARGWKLHTPLVDPEGISDTFQTNFPARGWKLPSWCESLQDFFCLSKPTSPQGDGNSKRRNSCSEVSAFPNQLPRKGMETFEQRPQFAHKLAPFQTNFPARGWKLYV